MNIPFNLFPDSIVPWIGIGWMLVVWLFTAIIHVGFAMAILADAEFLRKHLGRRTFFVGGGFWAFATLVGGVFVAAIYWLVHHSTLRHQSAPPANSGPTAP